MIHVWDFSTYKGTKYITQAPHFIGREFVIQAPSGSSLVHCMDDRALCMATMYFIAARRKIAKK